MSKVGNRLEVQLGPQRTLRVNLLAARKGISQTHLLNKIVEFYLQEKERVVLAFRRSVERSPEEIEEDEKIEWRKVGTVKLTLSATAEAELRVAASAARMSLGGFLRMIVDDTLSQDGTNVAKGATQ